MSITHKLSAMALALPLTFTLATSTAFAQAKAPEPVYTIAFNAGAVTDYRYRGISQSGKGPAAQGGLDYTNKNGFYAGLWGSSIKWIKDSGAGATGEVEIDVYGGYKAEVGAGVTLDVGYLQYIYAGNTFEKVTGANADTGEVYLAASMGPATVKYSRAVTNLFGTANSNGSGYLDISATFDVGSGISVTPHLGVQNIKNFGSYRDLSLAVSKDFDGLVVSATLVNTNWASKFGAPATLPGSGSKNLAGSGLVLGVKKNF